MKKTVNIVLALLLSISITACAPAASSTASSTPSSSEAESKSESPVTSSSVSSEVVAETNEEGTIGDYVVKILDYSIIKDYEEKPTIVVSYEFTNNSTKNEAFIYATSAKAFQDGIELETAIVMSSESSVYDSGLQMREVQPGATLVVQKAYVLLNEASNVEVEVSELFSFDDNKLTKEFVIGQ